MFLGLLALLVDELSAPVDQRGEAGRSPLAIVLRTGCAAATKALLERGARVDVRDAEGWLPLHSVCMGGERHVSAFDHAKLTYVHPCERRPSTTSATPYFVPRSLSLSLPPSLSFFLPLLPPDDDADGRDRSEEMDAERVASATLLLKAGADVNGQSLTGCTALMCR